MNKEKYKEWNIIYNENYSEYLDLARKIVDGNLKEEKILKDNKRSKVISLNFMSKKLILKEPRQKNKNKWMRFISIFRNGEALASLIFMNKLEKKRIKTQKGIMALEKRKNTMLIDSFLIYFYEEGSSCTKKEYPLVIEALKDLHKKAYYHSDSHLENFIYNGEEVIMIDCKPKRKKWGRACEKWDFLSLEKSYFENLEDEKEMKDLLLFYKKGISYFITKTYWDWIQVFRKTKKFLRRGRGYENR